MKRLVETSHRDWENSHPIDLTDAGLLADMEKHGAEGAAGKLGITESEEKESGEKKHSKH